MAKRTACITVAVLAVLAIGFGLLLPAEAKIVPLRSGKVVSTHDTKASTFIEAVDPEGKTFWVLASICVVGQGGTVDVLAGAHYDEVKSEDLGKTIKDVYTAQLLQINGQEIKGLGAHGLPAGCVTVN